MDSPPDKWEKSVFHLLLGFKETLPEFSPSLKEDLRQYVPEDALRDYEYWLSPEKNGANNEVKEGIRDSIFRQEVEEFIHWKLEHAKRLLDSKSYTKSFQHTNIVLNHVLPKNSFPSDEQFCLAVLLRNKAQLFITHYSEAIESSSFKGASNVAQLRLMSEDRNFFLPDYLDEENEKIYGVPSSTSKASAKVIVDPNGLKGVNAQRQFVVKDLHSALKIARESDVIYVNNGTYDCSKSSGKTLHIKKSVSLVGSSKSEVKIRGSIVKWESCHELILDNLQIDVQPPTDDDKGDASAQSEEDVYLLGGRTELRGCVVEASVNTAIYLLGSEGSSTTLVASFSIFDGLETCRRMICPKGSGIHLSVENCYVSDCLSFITLIDPEESLVGNTSYIFKDSTFSQMQDIIHISPMSQSRYDFCAMGCIFDICIIDDDVTSAGIHLEGGAKVQVKNNKFSLFDLDSKALFLRDVHSGVIEMSIVELLGESPRATSLSEGISLLGLTEELVIQNILVTGMRIGINLSIYGNESKIYLKNCEMRDCSLGLCFESKDELPKELIIENLELSSSHYGLMLKSFSSSGNETTVRMDEVIFNDVPLPALVHKDILPGVSMKGFKLQCTVDYDSMESMDSTLRSKMFMYLATEKNMPYRVAYEKDEFVIVEDGESLARHMS